MSAVRNMLLGVTGCLLLGACSFLGGEDDIPLEGTLISIEGFQEDRISKASGTVSGASPSDSDWLQNGGNSRHFVGSRSIKPGPWVEINRLIIGEGSLKQGREVSEPLVRGALVYAADALGKVSAYNYVNNDLLWSVQLNDPSAGIGVGLALAESCLIVTEATGDVYCLDAQTGKGRWKASLPAPVRNNPSISGDLAVVLGIADHVTVIDIKTGKTLWEKQGAFPRDIRLVGQGSPAVDGKLLYALYSNGDLHALNRATGEPEWELAIEAPLRAGNVASTLSSMNQQVIVSDDIVYAQSHVENLLAINKGRGEVLWSRPVGSSTLPWVSGNTLLTITNQQELLALNRDNGTQFWRTALPKYQEQGKPKSGRMSYYGPVMTQSEAIVGTSSGELLRFDLQSGKLLGRMAFSAPIVATPVVSNNLLFVQTADGYLRVLK